MGFSTNTDPLEWFPGAAAQQLSFLSNGLLSPSFELTIVCYALVWASTWGRRASADSPQWPGGGGGGSTGLMADITNTAPPHTSGVGGGGRSKGASRRKAKMAAAAATVAAAVGSLGDSFSSDSSMDEEVMRAQDWLSDHQASWKKYEPPPNVKLPMPAYQPHQRRAPSGARRARDAPATDEDLLADVRRILDGSDSEDDDVGTPAWESMPEFAAAREDAYTAAMSRPRGHGYVPQTGYPPQTTRRGGGGNYRQEGGSGGHAYAGPTSTIDRWATDRIKTSSALNDHATWLKGLRQSLQRGTSLTGGKF